jgi:two-component system sensor histidine kinase CreC
MSLRWRLLLLLLLVYAGGGYYLTQRALEQLRPRYLESMEETLVDTSVLLASLVETQIKDGRLDAVALDHVFAAARRQPLDARIYSLHKTAVDMRVYVTDAAGVVIYDSAGRELGRDNSRWNDVKRTLAGQYGARSTRSVAGDDNTQVIHVAAPIRHEGRIIGVLSVGKPTSGVNELVRAARKRLVTGAVLGGLVVLALLLLVAVWAIAPLERLTAYARAVRDGRGASLPALPGRTLRDLGTAFEEMRTALEGRHHVERYTQALAHEVKAPLAAIRGAAELLDEDMPEEQRRKFMENIRGEAARIQRIIDRLLELSSLEARKQLRQVETVPVSRIAREAAEVVRPVCAAKQVSLEVREGGDPAIRGEAVLLREALVNLLQNAADFSPPGKMVTLAWLEESGRVILTVEDEGPGVPDYALGQVFERFYSLPRPGSERKSTGLGLALVREIAHLHGGEAALANRPGGGARATLWIPRG